MQVERGGFWVLAQTQPGGRTLERRLKQHGAARRCEVCRAVSGYQAGELAAEDALGRAGWDRSNPVQRSMLLDIFGLPEPPAALQGPAPAAAPRRSRWPGTPSSRPRARPVEPAPFWPWPGQPAPADPALEAAVEALERGWTTPESDAHPAPEPVLEAGL